MKTVYVHLQSQSEPIKIEHVVNTYTKDGLFCVLVDRGVTSEQFYPTSHGAGPDTFVIPFRIVGPERVWKFPVQHIFRILEEVQ